MIGMSQKAVFLLLFFTFFAISSSIAQDADSDGLPDGWEIAYNFDPSTPGEELIVGTDPYDSSSIPFAGNSGNGSGDSEGAATPEDIYTNSQQITADLISAWIALSCGLSYELPPQGADRKTYQELQDALADNAAIGEDSVASLKAYSGQDNLFDVLNSSSVITLADFDPSLPSAELIKDTENETIRVACYSVYSDFTDHHPFRYLEASIQQFAQISEKQKETESVNPDSIGWIVQRFYLNKGFSEAVNAIAGVAMIRGNKELVTGLRRRFNENTNEKTQQELFHQARRTYTELLVHLADPVADDLLSGERKLSAEEGIRSNSNGISDVPDDLYRYTDMLSKYSLAALSEAKQLFYKENVLDVDNPPRNNFPGPEDLDLNNDGKKNSAGRDLAQKRTKLIGNQVYLHSLSLMAGQNGDEFRNNIGYELKRSANEANQLYRDINSGFNPQQLAGDFIPYQPAEYFISQASDLIVKASEAEAEARNSRNTDSVNQTLLRNELRGLQERYRDSIHTITGIPVKASDLETAAARKDYMDRVRLQEIPKGELGRVYKEIEIAALSADVINRRIHNLSERIATEEANNERITKLILKNGRTLSSLSAAAEMAKCCQVVTGVLGGLPFAGVLVDIGVATRSERVRASELLQSIQAAEQSDIDSDAIVKNLLLEQATQYLSLESSAVDIERTKARLDSLWVKLDQLITNHVRAAKDLSVAYYNDPSYRLEATRDEAYAEDTFEAATEAAYTAARALEYTWSEKYTNPVLDLNGGLASPLSIIYDPYVRAESVFSAQFAQGLSPSLQDYLSALKAWDVRMRQMRQPEHQIASVRFSMRDDILGFGVFPKEIAASRFRNFISENRVPGSNPDNDDLIFEFNMDIVTERFFPALPNIKIDSVSVNLVSDPNRSIRTSDKTDAAIVDLVMLDRAYVRSFFADYPLQDDLISYDLQEGRTIDQSPFLASVSATVNGYASPLPPNNTQLRSHSPAANKWILRMKNNRFNNRDLKLEYLRDIELQINYSFGKPGAIGFPAGL